MSKGTPSMGKKQKSTHIRCRRCGDIPITSRSGLAPRVAMANLLDAVNSVGVSETDRWPSTRSEDFAPEMAKSLLNQRESIPDVWHHRSRRAS